MLKELLLYITVLFVVFGAQGQGTDRPNSDKISDCDGATIILRPGSYEMEFTGDSGLYDDIVAYSSIKETPEKNSLWTEFTAPFDGTLSLDAYCKEEHIQLAIFTNFSTDPCGDIFNGKAEIERLISIGDADTIGLRKNKTKGFLFPVTLKKGQSVYMYINNQSKNRDRLHLSLFFEPSTDPEMIESMKKVLDLKRDVDQRTLSIEIRDAETGLTVIAQLIMNDGKSASAMYRGSDFVFDITKSAKVNLNVDAEGYFFYDREESISLSSDHDIVIWLEPVTQGKQLEIKGIEFNMGSSEFAPGTEAKLKRLRDFLALNSEIRIEIQGHVHSVGENSVSGKRMSTARAKKVMNFLIENGVDKSRLEAVGYGNEFMKYPEPKFSYEEQANRRVEIKIL